MTKWWPRNRGTIPDRGEIFFSSPQHSIGSGAHPTSYPVGTEGKAAWVVPVVNQTPPQKGIWGTGDTAPCILNLGTRWRLTTSLPCRFTPRERSTGTHWTGSWVGLTAGTNAIKTRKIAVPSGNRSPIPWLINPYRLFRYQETSDWAITSHKFAR
jgi:hypothetical protein